MNDDQLSEYANNTAGEILEYFRRADLPLLPGQVGAERIDTGAATRIFLTTWSVSIYPVVTSTSGLGGQLHYHGAWQVSADTEDDGVNMGSPRGPLDAVVTALMVVFGRIVNSWAENIGTEQLVDQLRSEGTIK